jgi:hypothetical protein
VDPGIGAGGLNWSKGRSAVLDGTDDDEADETALHETLIRPAGGKVGPSGDCARLLHLRPTFDQRNSVAASRGSQALRVKHPRDRTWLSIAVGGSRIFRAYGMLL